MSTDITGATPPRKAAKDKKRRPRPEDEADPMGRTPSRTRSMDASAEECDVALDIRREARKSAEQKETKPSLSIYSKTVLDQDALERAGSRVTIFCHFKDDLKAAVLVTGQNLFRLPVFEATKVSDLLGEISLRVERKAEECSVRITTDIAEEYCLCFQGKQLSPDEAVLPLTEAAGTKTILRCERKAGGSLRRVGNKARKHAQAKKAKAGCRGAAQEDPRLRFMHQSTTSMSRSLNDVLAVAAAIKDEVTPTRTASLSRSAASKRAAPNMADQSPRFNPSLKLRRRFSKSKDALPSMALGQVPRSSSTGQLSPAKHKPAMRVGEPTILRTSTAI